MEKDLKLIKKKYGEKMMHYCRSELSTILEKEGLLPSLLLQHFNESHILYDDIEKEDKLEEFKNYIYSLIDVENDIEAIPIKETPKELLNKAGYDFYECKTEEDIQSFKKYYSKGEELCTFRGGRLKTCHVFFAVKKNVDEIKRKNFSKPRRQDEYGTSVISIQFTKVGCNLSIKNRYNHKVNNPDATFSNNLDNIIGGLTKSFENEYGFIQTNICNFELENYVDVVGKYYKYNYEINNIYYCLDNVIIDNFDVQKYDKERYIVFDYFVLDLKEKKILTKVNDSFIDGIVDIDKINITKLEDGKEIHLIPVNGEEIIIKINNQNLIVKYQNNNIKQCGDDFLPFNESLQEINLLNLEQCGDSFLHCNELLQKLNLPSLKKCGYNFLCENKSLQEINLPKLEQCGNSFLYDNESLQKINLPNLKKCGDSFLNCNELLQKLNLPNLKKCGDDFLRCNKLLQELNLPNLEQCEDTFLSCNELLQKLNLPNLKKCGDYFLDCNKSLQKLNLPNLEQCEDTFLSCNELLQKLNLPNLKKCGDYFLDCNKSLQKLNLPNLEQCGDNFLYYNESLQEINLPSLKECGDYFLRCNKLLQKLNLPNLEQCGDNFLYSNELLKELNLQKNIKLKKKLRDSI